MAEENKAETEIVEADPRLSIFREVIKLFVRNSYRVSFADLNADNTGQPYWKFDATLCPKNRQEDKLLLFSSVSVEGPVRVFDIRFYQGTPYDHRKYRLEVTLPARSGENLFLNDDKSETTLSAITVLNLVRDAEVEIPYWAKTLPDTSKFERLSKHLKILPQLASPKED